MRRIICYIKKWRNEKYENASSDHSEPPSIGLTLLAIDCFVQKSTDEGDDDLFAFQQTMEAIKNRFSSSDDNDGNIVYDIAEYLPVEPRKDVFQKMRDSSSSYINTFYNRLSTAVDNLTNAVNVESAHDAGVFVQKVLGDEFKAPDKEAKTAAAQNRREHSFG